jgi:hypothetical protein
MTMQEAQADYFSFMGNTCTAECKPKLGEIENSIEECKAMLDCAIYRADKDEISFWRRMLQTAKVQRREILTT